MILTVTMNPSVDISYTLNQFNLDKVNRTDQIRKTAGGKGLNVARVVHQLGIDVCATGIVGGPTGDKLTRQLDEQSIAHDFAKINQDTRNCIAILHEGNQTEILESGPTLTHKDAHDFIKKFTSLLPEADYVTISGSLPKGLDPDFYNVLLKWADNHDKKVLLDVSGAPLKEALEHASVRPYFIKPNETELADLLGIEIKDDVELKTTLSHEMFDGITWVVASLGRSGAMIRHEGEFYRARIPVVEAVNPVGSGDATVGGWVAALKEKKSPVDVIKTGMTAGVLNALHEQTGNVDVSQFDEIFGKIEVEKI